MSSMLPNMFMSFEKRKAINPLAQIRIEDIQEFYYIVHIGNLPSILEKGILSNSRVSELKLERKDISDPKIQDIREDKVKPVEYYPGKELPLHRFVNLYLNPHNAMMAQKAPENPDLCVLRISSTILQRGDVILTSQNAATHGAVRTPAKDWSLSPKSSGYLSRLSVMTREELQKQKRMKYFSDHYHESTGVFQLSVEEKEEFNEQYESVADFFQKKAEFEKPKRVRQAEALVRSKVKPRFITGIFVPNRIVQEKINKILTSSNRTDIIVTENLSIFIGYKAKPQDRGSYLNLAPFMVPKLSEEEEKKLLGDDYGYPSDLSDEENPSYPSPFKPPMIKKGDKGQGFKAPSASPSDSSSTPSLSSPSGAE